MSNQAALHEVLAHHEAERILASEPRHVDALHQLGVAAQLSVNASRRRRAIGAACPSTRGSRRPTIISAWCTRPQIA